MSVRISSAVQSRSHSSVASSCTPAPSHTMVCALHTRVCNPTNNTMHLHASIHHATQCFKTRPILPPLQVVDSMCPTFILFLYPPSPPPPPPCPPAPLCISAYPFSHLFTQVSARHHLPASLILRRPSTPSAFPAPASVGPSVVVPAPEGPQNVTPVGFIQMLLSTGPAADAGS